VSYSLIIRPEAEADMAEAFGWYEERKAGLGYEFLEEVAALFRQIQENPLRHAEVYGKARRALIRRFPYKVFYLFEGAKVEVIGVVHAKRDPQIWQKRAP
jgi:plasmid stabilization system protein ParE